MANGNGLNGGVKWIMGVLAVLVAAGVTGSISTAIGQGKLETQVEANRREIKDRAAIIATIPVIANDVEHIRQELLDIKSKMKSNQEEVLEAIREK